MSPVKKQPAQGPIISCSLLRSCRLDRSDQCLLQAVTRSPACRPCGHVGEATRWMAREGVREVRVVAHGVDFSNSLALIRPLPFRAMSVVDGRSITSVQFVVSPSANLQRPAIDITPTPSSHNSANAGIVKNVQQRTPPTAAIVLRTIVLIYFIVMAHFN